MNKLKLLNGAALLSLIGLTWSPTWAQTASTPPAAQGPSSGAVEAPPSDLETINVSASRIQIVGYDQPTPVTIVGKEELERDARTDVADVIRQLPSFGASSSPTNSAEASNITAFTSGINEVSLRNLGQNRTLVLFDGQRVVASNIRGGVDFSTIPASLVERIDVVTGGASAAWGSDAVAGVVNVILDKKFTGVQANIEHSDTFSNERRIEKAELSLGTGFADDRGHFIVSGSVTDAPDTFFANQINGYKSQRLIDNPNGGAPAFVHADYVGLSEATPGGLITGPPGSPLKGIYFTGQSATPAVFNFGNSAGGQTAGGTPNYAQGDLNETSTPFRTATGLAIATFKVTDDIKATLQVNYGQYSGLANSYSDVQYGNLTINADNPYIPASVKQQMTALGIPSFQLGTTMLYNGNQGSIKAEANSVGTPVFEFHRALSRGVFSLDGSIGENFTWNAYYQRSEVHARTVSLNNTQNALLTLAVDAVTVTGANRGTSGLPVGSIACRSTLTNPTNGCQPANVFGLYNISDASQNYFNGVARAGGDRQDDKLQQDVGAATIQGTTPWGFSAGKISTAFGLEYRKEQGEIKASPSAQASTYQLGNPKNFGGDYDVKEGFLEFNVPILKDQGVKSLSMDVAGRYTDYSTSGSVETYKVGLVSQLVDDFRLRASYSYDIRAPDLIELFNTGTPITGVSIDPRTGKAVSVFNVAEGNLDLKPEEATTTSVGFVFTPSWLSGANFSIDYYNIDIKKAINSYSSSVILAQCAAGLQLFCANLDFNGPGGALSAIHSGPLNADSETTSGLDIAADYRVPFMEGAIDVNLVANYMFEQTYTSLGSSYDFAGGLSYDSPYLGAPKFRGTLSVTYVQGGAQGTIQARSVGSAHLVSAWTNGVEVDNNDIAAVYYMDLRGSYKFENGIQAYGAIDNVLDHNPPVVAQSYNASSGYETPFKDTFYDGLGRVYRVGLRYKF